MPIEIQMSRDPSFSIERAAQRVTVYGSFFEDPNIFEIEKFLHNPSEMDLDGDYLLIAEDTKKKTGEGVSRTLIVRGGYETFPVYSANHKGSLLLSDDLFSLAAKISKVSWNLEAVSDYFSTGWNNSQKGDKTPFREVSKLEPYAYILGASVNGLAPQVKRWKGVSKSVRYTYGFGNLDEFKKDFLSLLECYIRKIREENLGFSVSGGIDSGALAVMSCAKIKDKNLDFFTISYGGPEDESALAQKLDSLLSKPVEVLKISPPESFMKQLRRLLLITQSPYSDIEGLTHLSYFESIRDHGCRTLILGFGADLTFGGTPYEYPAFARDLLIRGRFLSAYRVFLAYLSGTRGETKTVYSVFAFLLFVYYEIFRRLIPDAVISRMRRRVAALRADDFHTLTNVPMKAPAQGEKAGYQEALKKAYGDSALRQLSQILYAFGISPVYPYEGKGFANLAKKCDPLIFAYNENKYCIRYALSQHLPKEILANKKKFGNAGFERELFDENKYEILNYVRTARATKKNSIVNIPALEEALTQDIFTDNVFRAINLLLFEDIVREHEIELSFCEN